MARNDMPAGVESDDATAVSPREQAGRFGLAFLETAGPEILDPDLVADVPVEWARANVLLPVRIQGELCVLTADASRAAQQNYLQLLIGADLRPVLAERAIILKAIEECYYSKKDTPTEFLRDLGTAEAHPRSGAGRGKTADLLEVAENAPVTQFMNLILLQAVKKGASDIHLEPFESRLRIRYRMDGVLYEQESPPKAMEDALVSRVKIMARMDVAEKRLPQDGMARVRVGEREIDIRVSTIPVAEGERVVLRLLDRDSALLPLSALGMSKVVLSGVKTALQSTTGIFIVCGPTGAGKTTTLYAVLGQEDASRKNVLTIEDPIEYQLPDIGQIQVKPKIGLTFASGLRHILRQDPDVVLVGETRDRETADIAVRASLTGHFVFTTLHTNDAPGAVVRLVDMGVEPYLLASCLRGVLSQRLVRKLCSRCREPYLLTESDKQRFSLFSDLSDGRTFYAPRGCEACLEGYRGRTGLFELMLVNHVIREGIRHPETGFSGLREIAERAGMVGLTADGLDKMGQGVTSPEEVLAVAGPV